MGFDSGSERLPPLKSLEPLERRKQSTEIPLSAVWSRAWINAWPWAKTVAMEVEDYVRHFGQPWADGWIRAEADWARALAQAQAPADMWRRVIPGGKTVEAEEAEEAERAAKAEARAHTEALALAGA